MPVEPNPVAAEVAIASLPVEPNPVAPEAATAQLPVEPAPVVASVVIAQPPVEPAPVAPEATTAQLPVEPNPVAAEVAIASLPVEPAPVAPEATTAQLPVEPNPVAPEAATAQLPVEPAPVVASVVIAQPPVEPAPIVAEVAIAQSPVEPAPIVASVAIAQPLAEPAPTVTEVPVNSLERLAFEATEPAIPQLQNPQQTLSKERQTLAYLSLTQLKLTDLAPSVAQEISQNFQKYHEASTLAATVTKALQQPAEGLTPDASPSQIEQGRLQSLQDMQKELDQLLAELGQHKTVLEEETQQVWNEMEQQIPLVELKWIQANISLLPVFSGGDSSLGAALWRNAAALQLQLAQSCRKKAALFEAQRQQYAALAAGINPHFWQVVGYQRNACGRQGEIWGWVTDSHPLAQKNHYLLQAAIAAQNRQALQNLAELAQQQSATILWPAKFIENSRISPEPVASCAGDVLAQVQPQERESLNPQKAPEKSQLPAFPTQQQPAQPKSAGAPAQGFQEIPSEVTSIPEKAAAKARDLQTARLLLLYWQQLAVRKALQQLESAKVDVELAIQQAGRAKAQLRTLG